MKQTTNSFKSGNLSLRRQMRWFHLAMMATFLAVVLQVSIPFSHSSIAPVAHAANFTVNQTADALDINPGNGVCDTDGVTAGDQCSLRAAIQEANALAGADNITFDAALNGSLIVINIAPDGTPDDNLDGDFDVNTTGGNLTITGNGITNTIIDGDATDRVFHHVGNGTFTINNVTVQNGFLNGANQDGAGLFNSGGGTLNINNSLITGNRITNPNEDGGGVANTNANSVTNITNTTITDNEAADSGGGIFNSGGNGNTRMNIFNSTISGNRSLDQGGGIYSARAITIEKSTISGNTATNDGGGIVADFGTANISLNRVTVANNVAFGGNGGGILRLNGALAFQNSLIGGNTAGGAGPDCSGTVTSGAPNNPSLIQNGTGCTGLNAADLVGVNPNLGPLQLNTPGTTETHALLAGSPAIDAGGTNCTEPDQRGVNNFDVPNVGTSTCDIGAYEFNDPLPGINIANATITEGDPPPATQDLNFTVTLTATTAATVTVQYATQDAGATQGTDYTNTTGTLQIPPGNITGTIAVPIISDTTAETPLNENLQVNLSNATWATINIPQAIGTITDNDVVTASIADATPVTEGNPPTSNKAVFTISLSKADTNPVTVTYETVAGTATSDVDYTAVTSQDVIFNVGETQKDIEIDIIADTISESDETFSVRLTNISAGSAIDTNNDEGTGTIVDDDTTTTPTLPSISIGNATVTEGDSGTTKAVFEVRLSGASTQTITVDYTTGGGDATSGQDYQAVNGTLSFPPGTTVRTIEVTINGDTTVEGDEVFGVILSNATPTGVTITDAEGTGTITNDDQSVTPTSTPTGSKDNDDSDDDDDNDGGSAPPPAAPPASSAPAAAPPAQAPIPVSVLPETGLSAPQSMPGWPLVAVVSLAGVIALAWVARRRYASHEKTQGKSNQQSEETSSSSESEKRT